MTLLSAQKILICRSALALAAVLLHSATAISAESADGGHAQARALLSGAGGMRMDRTSTALPAAGLAAFAHDPQDQARSLLAKGASSKERRADEFGAGVTEASSAESQGTTYAGAQESARKMILGRGA
jgi:hypothetical protein